MSDVSHEAHMNQMLEELGDPHSEDHSPKNSCSLRRSKSNLLLPTNPASRSRGSMSQPPLGISRKEIRRLNWSEGPEEKNIKRRLRNHPSAPSSLTIGCRRTARAASRRPVVQLSVNLLRTFNAINQKFEENRRNTDVGSLSKKGEQPVPSDWHHLDDHENNYVIRKGEILNERYSVEAVLGKGSFGKVVRAWDRVAQERVAIKIVKSRSAFLKQSQIEIGILQSLAKYSQSGHIVKIKEYFMHHAHQCLVFEHLSINLFELLVKTDFAGVSLTLISTIGKQLLICLEFLSSKKYNREPIIHCDLKPENILLESCEKASIKVIDFGSACFENQKMYTYIQSRFYRAPEILLGLRYSCAIDMWSLGCILVELYTGKPLFDGTNERDQIIKQVEVLGMPPQRMIERSRNASKYFVKDTDMGEWKLRPEYQEKMKPHSLHSFLSSASTHAQNSRFSRFEDLVSKMLQYSPVRRIKPDEALRHSFFQSPPIPRSASEAPSETPLPTNTVHFPRSSTTPHIKIERKDELPLTPEAMTPKVEIDSICARWSRSMITPKVDSMEPISIHSTVSVAELTQFSSPISVKKEEESISSKHSPIVLTTETSCPILIPKDSELNSSQSSGSTVISPVLSSSSSGSLLSIPPSSPVSPLRLSSKSLSKFRCPRRRKRRTKPKTVSSKMVPESKNLFKKVLRTHSTEREDSSDDCSPQRTRCHPMKTRSQRQSRRRSLKIYV